MATFSTLDFGIDGGIARITLNRPESANGISMQLAQELLQVMGFRQFLLRGLENVQNEWTLVCMAWNLKRMAVLRPQ